MLCFRCGLVILYYMDILYHNDPHVAIGCRLVLVSYIKTSRLPSDFSGLLLYGWAKQLVKRSTEIA